MLRTVRRVLDAIYLAGGVLGALFLVTILGLIVAQMIASGEIAAKGVLNPALDVPYAPFMAALAKRGIVVTEELQ